MRTIGLVVIATSQGLLCSSQQVVVNDGIIKIEQNFPAFLPYHSNLGIPPFLSIAANLGSSADFFDVVVDLGVSQLKKKTENIFRDVDGGEREEAVCSLLKRHLRDAEYKRRGKILNEIIPPAGLGV
ncbi:hypothetical protein WISP_31184 [Willisornis vidua]|uniref:Uncharacterized protein n=1 Tax=Willisornis vidua TaxID=1566151 RepID=A0ABQ9DK01_9PASS|nr:hypothetical protein WISP_31184 [Willisornis vidua]